ncbi:MAG: BatA domain-containing protein, partial [Gemmataceae bacterium]
MLNSLFLHPGFMIAGGLLICLPILIHLINRMRYKRIRWAAMEFLLKSQKRNRRRLIIEQLLLLTLRCLLVALTGFLVARYVGNLAGGISAQTTEHVVVLDDSPSMGDHEDENAQDHDCMEIARKQIVAIAKMTSQANAAQQFKVLLLSDLVQSDTCQPIFDKRISVESLGELENKLQDIKPSAVHVKAVKGVKAARDFINNSVEGKKVLHYVSDFRETDWNGADQDLSNEIDGLLAKGVNVFLIDTAYPLRKESQPIAPEHPNVAIVDLQADSRVASSEGRPVEFTLTISNYGP